jgi:flagellar biosynthesis/type III secretory pathway protein FliH
VLAEGEEKGLEKGREEGKLEAQRQTLLDIVQERFPEIARLAKRQADAIEDPEVLRRLTVKISGVKTSQEAEQYLLNPGSIENRH